MVKKKKNTKIEKFSPFTFFVIASVLGGLIIASIIRIKFHEYIPQANLFGESGLIEEPKVPQPYNEGDIFKIFSSWVFWIYSVFIVVFIINIFRKNFLNNFIRVFGYTTSKNDGGFYRHEFWIWWLIAIPIIVAIGITCLEGLVHFINYQFNTSLPKLSWWFILLILFGIGSYMDRKK